MSDTLEARRQAAQLAFVASGQDLQVGDPQRSPWPLEELAALTPEQAHQAKLAALQALLALGDAKAERAAESGQGQFADTQPADEEYPATQFVDRGDPAQPVSLLNLDKLPPRQAKT